MSISRGVPGKNNTVAQLHAIAGYVRGVSVTILDSIYERVAPQQAEEASSRARPYVPRAIRVARAVQDEGYRSEEKKKRMNKLSSADLHASCACLILLSLVFARCAGSYVRCDASSSGCRVRGEEIEMV